VTEAVTNNAISIFNGYGGSLRDVSLLLPGFDETDVELLSISNLVKVLPCFTFMVPEGY